MSDHRNEETTNWNAGEVRAYERRGTAPQHPHPRRRRFSRAKYLLFVLTVSAVLAGCSWLLINDFCSLNKKDVTVTVEISSKESLSSVADKLHKAGLVKYKWFFTLFGKVEHAEDKIGIGTYELNSSMDYLALITAMHNASGDLNAATVKVTIPEGYTTAQIIALLASKGVGTQEELTKTAQTGTFDYSFVDGDSQELSRLEGYLFPDTYDFYKNEKADSALKRLLSNFSSRMNGTRMAEIKASKYNLTQIVTIASLIEKETDGNRSEKSPP
jgi:UPF0755 protein